MSEQWRDIPGYDGLYQVSDAGNVRSWTKIKQGSLMTPNPVRGGHLMVRLTTAEGVSTQRSVHSLVAEVFIGPRLQGHVVRHKDDNPANNNIENLSYGTLSDNQRDAVNNGRNFQASKTHCKNGHLLLGDNLYERPDGSGRSCRTCRTDAAKRYRQRKKN
jgi:hypothetical protein